MDDSYLMKAIRVFLDPQAAPTADTLDLSDAGTVDVAEAWLRDYFDNHPNRTAVTVVLAGERAGTVTDRSLRAVAGTAQEAPNGAGERLAFPAASTRHRLLTFRCLSCAEVAHRARYDPRDLPECTQHHTTMELVR
jgi:hypothetical protein